MRVVLTVGLFFSFSGNALAADISVKVEQLIKQVELSECDFIRNGDIHTSLEAADHMCFKYDYYKDDIKSLSDFIEKVGTKSSFTGQIYEVECAGEEKTASAEWLKQKSQEIE